MYPFSMFPLTVPVAVLLSITAWLPAQSSTPGTFDLALDREPMVVLDGSWRFHPGDYPDGKLGWVNANFDLSTNAISNQSAEAIALAAQQFGQEDDITVLTLRLNSSKVAHA